MRITCLQSGMENPAAVTGWRGWTGRQRKTEISAAVISTKKITFRKNRRRWRPHLNRTIQYTGKGQSVAGSGRLPVRYRRHQLFSLALAFCASTRNGYGIYRLSSTDFVFLASINGVPAVTADKTGSADKMQELLTLFLSMNEPPQKAGTVWHQWKPP